MAPTHRHAQTTLRATCRKRPHLRAVYGRCDSKRHHSIQKYWSQWMSLKVDTLLFQLVQGQSHDTILGRSDDLVITWNRQQWHRLTFVARVPRTAAYHRRVYRDELWVATSRRLWSDSVATTDDVGCWMLRTLQRHRRPRSLRTTTTFCHDDCPGTPSSRLFLWSCHPALACLRLRNSWSYKQYWRINIWLKLL